MNYETIEIENKLIEKINFTDTQKKAIIKKAINLSLQKVENTINSWQKRNKLQILSDFLLGDIAKLCYKNFLEANNIVVIDYDQIRNDKFKNPDKFDLKINVIELEIKSSLEKYTIDLSTIVNKRRIIDNKNSCHEREHDIVCQVFFVPKILTGLQKSKEYEENMKSLDYNNENKIKMCNLILNEFDIYLLGWVDRKTLNLNKEIVKISNDKTNSKEREYGNFFIKNAFNNSELIKILENNNVKKLKF